MNMIRILIMLFISSAYAQPPLPVVYTELVKMKKLESTTWLPATILGNQDAFIATEIAGRITSIVDVGHHVSKGEVIASLDEHLLRLNQRENQAQVKRIKATLDLQLLQINRLKKLVKTNSSNQSELDRMNTDYKISVQNLNSAQVALERSRYFLKKASIKAPFDGLIVQRVQSIGEYVSLGTVLLRVVNPNDLIISVHSPSTLSFYNKVGEKVKLKNTLEIKKGVIQSMIPVSDVRTRMIEWRINPSQGQWIIGDGTWVALKNQASKIRPVVPRDALVFRSGKVSIFVVEPGDTVKEVVVQVEKGEGNIIGVEAELTEQQRVVVSGAELLKHGQKVLVKG